MNLNNRSVAPTNVPRTLRPKAVSVSPIKSPPGSVVPQAVMPIISSQGQSRYMLGGNVVPQIIQGASISQAVPGSQTAMTAQTLYPQSQNLPVSQPRMTVFPQSVAVSQNVPQTQLRISTPTLYPQSGQVSQTVPGTQQRLGAQALYPHISTVTQNLSAAQSRMSAQVLYPQSVQMGTQMQIRQNSVPVVQNSVPVAQSNIPMVQNNARMIVSAAPVFQTMGFQTQLNPQIRAGQQYAFPSQIASNVRSPIFSPTVTNVAHPFQQNYQVQSPVNLNPAYITTPNQGLITQVPSQLAVQQNIASRFIKVNQPQNSVQSQVLPVMTQIPEIKNNVTLKEAAQSEHLSVSEQEVSKNTSSDSLFKYLVKPATIIVKPATAEHKPEDISESDELGELSQTESFPVVLQELQSESDSYTEMTPDNSLISDAQIGSSGEKHFLQKSQFTSDEQESMVTADMQGSSSSAISSMVTTCEIDEILSLPPSFDSETAQPSQTLVEFDSEIAQLSQTSVEFANTVVDSEYSEMTGELTSMDEDMPKYDKRHLSYTTLEESAPEEVVDRVDSNFPSSIEPGRVSEESSEASSQIDEQIKDVIPSLTDVDSINNITDIGQSADNVLIDDTRWDNAVFVPDNTETIEEVLELRETKSVHSNIETKTKANGSVVADTFCQVCSSENSQDGAMSSDVLDIYTDDSNSITWENFHQTVLKLRANKNRDKSEVSGNTFHENSRDSNNLNCDKQDSGVISKDGENLVSQVKEDGSHEQSFEDEGEEPAFVWEDYLQQTGASAVPATAFKHVEYSLQSGFIRGMKLEVPNKSDPSTFWVASVLMTCGPLLRLRYDGYSNESDGDFWCDLNTTEVHPIGWSAQNERSLQPPDEIRDRVSDWRSFLLESLTGARTAPSYFFEKGAALSPIDQLKCGMKLELQDALNPKHVWLVQILENVGGRLYLRLDGTQSASKHFWMFYLNHRLHPIGWTNEQEGCVYRPPKDIYDEQTDESWAEILQIALKECEEDMVPEDVFKDQQELKPHQFAVGMKLEALIPGINMIGPATVTKVINNLYFIVEIDDLRNEEQDSVQICCNSEYLGIFPISWCQCKGIRLCPPQGWRGGDFVWGEYLSFCNAKAAPEKLFHSGTDDHDFERGMKLEAVRPDNPNQICAATITKIVGPLLWIHLDHMRDIPSHIEDIDSHNLFPVGWCESNNYQLKPPVKAKPRQRHLSECKTEEVYRSVTSSQTKGAWCPKIHLNHRCFSGPYLSKGRISDLPKCVGPGPMDLVLKEVLGLLISIAYVPCRALKEIQHEGPFNPYMKAHILKAKYKGKKYKAVVEVCQTESQMEEFCRNMCIKLECCPYLFSPLHVRNSCPENCQQLTKTKSNPNYVKKRKPSNFMSVTPSVPQDRNAETKKRGRKRKNFLYTHKKGQGHRSHDPSVDLKDEGFIDDYDVDGLISTERKAYDIQTRGAKLPKYSFERKSHRKILMTPAIAHVNKHKQGYKRLMQPKVWSVDVRPERPLIPREGSLKLESNPLRWTVAEVVQFLKTTDCSHLARIMKEQEVDGQAFMLLNLSAIQEHLELKLGPAVKLCHQIERLKLAFYENYA